MNRQIIKQKEEEVKSRLESANQPKSKLLKSAVYFDQMRGKFQQSIKTSSLNFRDPQLRLGESQKKNLKVLLLEIQQPKSWVRGQLSHSPRLPTSTKNRNEPLALTNVEFWILK